MWSLMVDGYGGCHEVVDGEHGGKLADCYHQRWVVLAVENARGTVHTLYGQWGQLTCCGGQCCENLDVVYRWV